MQEILNIIHKTIYQFLDACEDDVPMSDKDKLLLEVNKAICNNLKALEKEQNLQPTCNQLATDCISRQEAKEKLKTVVDEMTLIFSDIREKNVDDSVCGLCEYDCDYGIDGCANECPGFERDDCFKLKEEYRKEWTDLSNIPSVEPEKCGDCISRQAVLGLKTIAPIAPVLIGEAVHYEEVVFVRDLEKLPYVEPKRKVGKWIKHEWAEESDGRLIPNYECNQCHAWKQEDSDYCPDCGAKMEVET